MPLWSSKQYDCVVWRCQSDLEALAYIQKETGAEIVLSSTWRLWEGKTGRDAVDKARKKSCEIDIYIYNMYYIDYIRSVLISHLVASNVCVWTSLDLWCQHFCMSCMVHVGSEAFWHSEDCGANPRLEGQSRPCAIESWVTKLEFFTELSKLGAHGDPHGWNFVLVSRSVKPPPNEPNFFLMCQTRNSWHVWSRGFREPLVVGKCLKLCFDLPACTSVTLTGRSEEIMQYVNRLKVPPHWLLDLKSFMTSPRHR